MLERRPLSQQYDPVMVDASIRVRSVVLDCGDPPALAGFYGGLLDGRIDTSDPDWCEVHLEAPAFKLAFQRASGHQPPEWPNGAPQQIHLDLEVSDLEATSRRAVDLGANVLSEPVDEDGCTFVVHADPAGHPFCLCRVG